MPERESGPFKGVYTDVGGRSPLAILCTAILAYFATTSARYRVGGCVNCPHAIWLSCTACASKDDSWENVEYWDSERRYIDRDMAVFEIRGKPGLREPGIHALKISHSTNKTFSCMTCQDASHINLLARATGWQLNRS